MISICIFQYLCVQAISFQTKLQSPSDFQYPNCPLAHFFLIPVEPYYSYHLFCAAFLSPLVKNPHFLTHSVSSVLR